MEGEEGDEVDAEWEAFMSSFKRALEPHTYRSRWACLWLVAGVGVLVGGWWLLHAWLG